MDALEKCQLQRRRRYFRCRLNAAFEEAIRLIAAITALMRLIAAAASFR